MAMVLSDEMQRYALDDTEVVVDAIKNTTTDLLWEILENIIIRVDNCDEEDKKIASAYRLLKLMKGSVWYSLPSISGRLHRYYLTHDIRGRVYTADLKHLDPDTPVRVVEEAELGWVYVATTRVVDTDLDDFVIKITRNYRGQFTVSGVQFGIPTKPIVIKANIPRKDWQMTAGEAILRGFSLVRIMR